MFSLLKLIIWMAGVLVVAYFVLNYFGYTVNMDYFSASKTACQEKLKECADKTIHQGIDNIKCETNCVNPNLIIKKK
jgi:hypothetical protein